MRKKSTFIAILFVLSLLLAACNNSGIEKEEGDNPEENPVVNNGNTDNSEDSGHNENGENELLTPEEISDQVIQAVISKDMETVAHFVHPEKGLLFSPYIYIKDNAVVIEQEEIANLLDSDEVFNWGVYDGKGTSIELTPAEYFEEFLDMTPYKEPDEILVNDLQDRGNTKNNIGEVFPDAQVIEYYHKGSEAYGGIDWSSVLFIYEKDTDGVNQLVAIIRDVWTI